MCVALLFPMWYHLRLDGGMDVSGIIGALEKRPKTGTQQNVVTWKPKTGTWYILGRSEK